MRRIKNFSLLAGLAVFSLLLIGANAPIAEGVPVMPGVHTHEQSDGGIVSYQVIGDEYLSFMIDSNGKLVAFGDDGDLYYADWVNKGDFFGNADKLEALGVSSGRIINGFTVPTGIKPEGDYDGVPEIPESDMQPLSAQIPEFLLQYAGEKIAERDAFWSAHNSAKSAQGMNIMSMEAPGDRNLLVIYVRFENESNLPELAGKELTIEQISDRIFKDEEGSVAHYYKSVTNGAVKFSPAQESYGAANDGIIVVTVSGDHKNWRKYSNSIELIKTDVVKPALEKAGPFINISTYDKGLGYLDPQDLSILFIVHGFEFTAREIAGGEDTIPAISSHTNVSSGNALLLNGVEVRSYSASGAFHGILTVVPFTAGAPAHELGHDSLGFVDLYTFYTNVTRGIADAWSLMGLGCWGFQIGSQPGSTPSALDAYNISKYLPQAATVTDTMTNVTLTNPNQYIKLQTQDENQYFLLQPRGNVGYDRGIAFVNQNNAYSIPWESPYGGLMIYHIDESKKPGEENNDWTTRPFLKIMEAHGGARHMNSSYNDKVRASVDDLFFTGGKVAFNDLSDPSSQLYGTGSAQSVPSGGLSVTVTNLNVDSTAGNVAVTFNVTPALYVTIDAQPLDAAVTEGSITGSLSVGASANRGAALSYQWYSNTTASNTGGTSIAGATSASFAIPTTLTASGSPYYYYCVVSGTSAPDTKSASSSVATVTVAPAPVPPTITTASLPGGIVGVAYSATLAATGDATITWEIVGSLPGGLSLNGATGEISGTPTADNTFNFSVKATNGAGDDTKALSIVIVPAPVAPTITTASLPGGIVGVAYSATLAATGDVPITWEIVGSLPGGLSLNGSTGVISGTPTAANTFNFSVKATNGAGDDTKALSIVIVPAPVAPTITTASLPGGIVGVAY
ncbi:MAG: putative Ig domain-containing protein, partial [Synergistaceae bacterium]|nr:putative Ig domain-containing protein [Synergistaceae bacterium]